MKKSILFILFVLLSPIRTGAGLLFYETFDSENAVITNGGDLSGEHTFLPGIIGNSIVFSEDSRVKYSLTNSFDKEEGTIQFWLLSADENKIGFFDVGTLGMPDSWGIFRNYDKIYMEIKNDTSFDQATGPISIDDSEKWYFVSCPFWRVGTETRFKVCVNGLCKERYDGRIANSNPDETGDFYIGWANWYGYSNSQFDEFKLFDNVKSDLDIYLDYKKYFISGPKICTRLKPDSTGSVKINCDGLFLNDRPFNIKGLCYQPIPVGKDAESLADMQDMYDDERIRQRDFPLLRDMNANAVRTWAEVLSETWLDDLYNEGNNPVYVLMGFWIGCDEDYSNQTIRDKYKDKFRAYVNTYKDHPAVLAWLIGNENNLSYCTSKDQIGSFYSLCNELAQIAFEIEGSGYHPVGIVNGDLWNIGDEETNSNDESLDFIDFWGVNVYPGESFGSWFESYKLVSGKPLLITEYGIDAYDTRENEEYQDVHSQWIINQWKEIERSDVTIGSTLMEYSDEWWKAGNNDRHDIGGYDTNRHPDGYSNEEWWGVMRPSIGTPVDILDKRQVYYDLQKAWKEPDNLTFIPLLLLE